MGSGSTIKMLTDSLSSFLGRAVVDETGLNGQYDFKLQWDPQSTNLNAVPSPGYGTGVEGSVFTALSDQLGLRLESWKGPVRVYVIEKIEKRSSN